MTLEKRTAFFRGAFLGAVAVCVVEIVLALIEG